MTHIGEADLVRIERKPQRGRGGAGRPEATRPGQFSTICGFGAEVSHLCECTGMEPPSPAKAADATSIVRARIASAGMRPVLSAADRRRSSKRRARLLFARRKSCHGSERGAT